MFVAGEFAAVPGLVVDGGEGSGAAVTSIDCDTATAEY
jgi:hypothetical protein